MIKEISIGEAKRKFSEILNSTYSSGTRFILVKQKTPVAAIVNIDDLSLIDSKNNGEELGTLTAAQGIWAELDSLDQIIQDVYNMRIESIDREVEL